MSFFSDWLEVLTARQNNDDYDRIANMPYMQQLIFKAMDIAQEAHQSQKYGREPYFNHVFDAANLARHMGYNAQTVITLFLHDCVEDTDMTLDRLRTLGMPPSVVRGVDAMTFNDEVDNPEGLTGEPRRQLKLAKAKSTPLSHIGKFCDSSVNFGHTVTYPWMLSQEHLCVNEYALDYVPNLPDLSQGLPTPAEVSAYTAKVDHEWCADRYLDERGLSRHGLCRKVDETYAPYIYDKLPTWNDSRWKRVEMRVAQNRSLLAQRHYKTRPLTAAMYD